MGPQGIRIVPDIQAAASQAQAATLPGSVLSQSQEITNETALQLAVHQFTAEYADPAIAFFERHARRDPAMSGAASFPRAGRGTAHDEPPDQGDSHDEAAYAEQPERRLGVDLTLIHSKFMPKKPVMKVSGRKMVATTVSQYEVSFQVGSMSVAIESAAASIASTRRLKPRRCARSSAPRPPRPSIRVISRPMRSKPLLGAAWRLNSESRELVSRRVAIRSRPPRRSVDVSDRSSKASSTSFSASKALAIIASRTA